MPNTLITGFFVALIAAAFPLKYLAEATSIGTLFAFAIVNIGVIVLRRHPARAAAQLQDPAVPADPDCEASASLLPHLALSSKTWAVFAGLARRRRARVLAVRLPAFAMGRQAARRRGLRRRRSAGNRAIVGLTVLVGCMPDERGDDAVALAGGGRPAGRGRGHPRVRPARQLAGHRRWAPWTRNGRRTCAPRRTRCSAARSAGCAPSPRTCATTASSPLTAAAAAASANSPNAAAPAWSSSARLTGGRAASRSSSTADQLLHGSPVPVALAPWGYAAAVPERITRTTLAFHRSTCSGSATPSCGMLLRDRLDTDMRLLTVLARAAADVLGACSTGAWKSRCCRSPGTRWPRTSRRRKPACESRRGVRTGRRRRRRAALSEADWGDEVLVCSATDAGPLTRVFIGDVSLKIVRSAQVPVVVFPRGARLDGWR
ncbi:hypothetical protein ACU686_23060 [Yinghuangia aomiensis]